MTDATKIEVLVVDDDDDLRNTMVRLLERQGLDVKDASSAEDALEIAQRRHFDVAIFDMMLPGISGAELHRVFREQHPECEVIFLTGQGSIETAVEAMKSGAFDFLSKPFPLKDLQTRIQKAYERRTLRKENAQLKTLLKRSQPTHTMIGESKAMREVFRMIERAGPSDKAILIQGESGTGKELVARALHVASGRAEKPLVVINCAALPEPLLESELFGHEKGAFTGAVNTKQGLFEVADGGTLFIDEIGELPGTLQAKLLRVLEDGSLRRVGSIKERRVDVRLLAATNRRLQEEVEEGRFREDLYYRINVMSLELPPLRERSGDVQLLIRHFLGPHWEIEDAAVQRMSKYFWPGNIRQLANAIERAKIMADGHFIRLGDLPKEVAEAAAKSSEAPADPDDLSSIQRAKIVEVLQRESGNKSRAAKRLGIDRRKLYRLVEKFDIQPDEIK